MLQELYSAYQQQPDRLLDLPTAPEAYVSLFDELKQLVNRHVGQGKFDEAQVWVSLARRIAYQTRDRDHIAHANWCSAIFYSKHQLHKSLRYQQKAVTHFHKTEQREFEGRALIGYAYLLNLLGRFDEAEGAILKIIQYLADQPTYRDWPMIYINKSLIHIFQSRYIEAIAATKSAESIAVKLKDQYPERATDYDLYRAQALVNRGLAANLHYKVDLAYESLNHALKIFKQYEEDTAYYMGLVHLNLARLHTLQGDLFEALSILDEARENFESVNIKTAHARVMVYQSDIYHRLMMPRYSRDASVKAAKIFVQEGFATEGVEAYLTATDSALSEGKKKAARQYLEQSHPFLEHAPPLLKWLWQIYNNHPLLQTKTQYPNALQIVKHAVEELTYLGSVQYILVARLIEAELATKLEQNTRFHLYQTIIDDAWEHQIVHIEQSACMALAQLQPTSDAEQTLRRAADILVRSRQKMPVEELKANLLTGQQDIYVQLIEAQLENGKSNLAAQTLVEAKGGIWVDFATALAMPEKRMPDSAWVHARAELSHWQEEFQLTRQENDPNNGPYLKLCEEKIQHAKAALTEASRTDSRFDQAQAFFSSLPELIDIQHQLQQAQQTRDKSPVILDYFAGTNHVYVCLISTTYVEWIALGEVVQIENLMYELDMLIDLFSKKTFTTQQEAAEKQKTTIDRILTELYQQLFEPIETWLASHDIPADTLMIAPDQWLYALPWAALYNGATYLGERYKLTTFPSSASLAFHTDVEESSSPATTVSERALLLGYSDNLEYVNQELSRINEILPHATVIDKAKIKDFHWHHPPKCLHIASHGGLNYKTPLFSGLKMADEMFLLADVLNLNLAGTELVTLSACETGVTPEQGGVVLALAGAFLCAGAQTVLSSLWSVDDQATQLLMTAFYQAWQQGNSVAASLQMAQAHLRSEGFEHPFYWAAFQPLNR